MIKCLNCGADNKDTAKYCFACGMRIKRQCDMGHQYLASEPECPLCAEEKRGMGRTREAASYTGPAGSPRNARTQVPDDFGQDEAKKPGGFKKPRAGRPGIEHTMPYEDPPELVGWLVLMEGYDDPPYTCFDLTIGNNVIGERGGGLRGGAGILLQDKGVSAKHATLSYDKGTYWLSDEDSSNGTFVNGKRISKMPPVELQDDDQLELGRTRLIFKAFVNPLA